LTVPEQARGLEVTEKKMQTILCVDDDKKNLELLEALLSPLGYTLKFSGSGDDALRQIQAETPDLILLDVMMPILSGFAVLERLRSDERTRLIPVVLLTALNAEEDRISGIEAGCDDFISKPFNKNELIARVRSLLKLGYYRRSLDEKEKFEAVIQELRDGVIVCSSDWTVVRINRSAQRYLELREGDSLLERIWGHYSVSISRELLTDLSQGHKEFDIKREATEEFKALFLEAHLDVLKNTSRELSSLVLTIRDVTQQRNESFITQDFFSLLSHKFNTPILVIQEVLDLLRTEIQSRKNLEFLASAESKLKDIHRLSQRMIYVLDVQSQGMNNVFQEDFLKNSVYKTKEKLDAQYGVVSILEKDISVQQVALWKIIVLEELMENSYKFRDKDGLRLKLTLTEDAMTFSDNGVGIPPEEQEKIYEPFYQIYNVFDGNIPGLGLGLTLVKRLVELNRGKIEVESGSQKGTTIKILFGPSAAQQGSSSPERSGRKS